MTKRTGEDTPLRVFVLDSEALSLAVRGDRAMIARLELAAGGAAEVVTSPMTLIEAYDARTTERRWDWVPSRVRVADIGREEAREARRPPARAGPHGHRHAIDAVLASRQPGQVTVFTSDVDDLERLVPDRIVVFKV
ncbi:hypothetical protein [Streptomyces sp. NPDC094049]|uniref:hypothetical protein n=1 Tax=Streptomyces sp. NPDC094049 TaxID=3154987 RepID=UPI00331A48FB